MKSEFLIDQDGSTQLTVTFDSRADMLRFKPSYDKFVDLFPPEIEPPPVSNELVEPECERFTESPVSESDA